jgi:hypothetical protein
MQILIWGDEMKRKISICIIVLIAVIVLIILFTNEKKETIPKETETLEVTEETETVLPANTDNIHYAYLVKAREQKLVVYCSDGETVYFETGIAVRSLSESMQQKAEEGIGFFTEADLYDFLESYSS